jgi:hypothetical protein
MYNNGRQQPLAPIGGGIGLETRRYNNTLDEINNQQNQFQLYEHQRHEAYQQQQFNNNADNYTEYPPLGQQQQNNQYTSDYRENMPEYMYDNYVQPKQQQQQQQQRQQYQQQQSQRQQQQYQQQQPQRQQQQQYYQQQYPQNYDIMTNRPQQQQQQQQQQQRLQRAGSARESMLRPSLLLTPAAQQPIQQQNRDPRLRPRIPPPPAVELRNEPVRTVNAAHVNQRRTPPTFAGPWLLHDLVKHDQVARHLGNWEKFPKSLGQRLDEFLADIKPPLPDDEFRAELATVGKECRVAIRDVVVQHLLKQSGKITDRLYECDGLPGHIQDVKKLAFETIKRRYGKLNRDSIDGLNRLTKMFGNGVSQADSLKPYCVKVRADPNPTCTLLSATAPLIKIGNDIISTVADGILAHHEEMEIAEAVSNSLVEDGNVVRNGARKSLLYNVTTNNRFTVLGDVVDSPGKRKRQPEELDSTNPAHSPTTPSAKEPRTATTTPPLQQLPSSPRAEDSTRVSGLVLEPSTQSQTSSPPHHSQRTIGARKAVNPKITITVNNECSEPNNKGKITVHKEGQNFALNLDSTVTTLIIGSSNLRSTPETDINLDNHIVCIPGANLQYVTAVVKKLNEHIIKGELGNLQHVVVTTGLNNRDDAELPPIADQLNALDKLEGGVAGIYMGISVNKDRLTELQNHNVEFINNEGITRENRYIEPLETCSFASNIHYDDETTHHIMERINEFIQDFQYE